MRKTTTVWVVLLNGRALDAADEALSRRIAELFRSEGIDARVRQVNSAALESEARVAAADPAVEAVVAAGGDGTVSSVAQAVAGSDKPMAVLPLGTRNHFARDVGIPLDLPGAVRAAATRHVRAVDVGDVNGRVFVNNSSVGLYPDMIRERERHRWRRRAGKLLATFRASWRALARLQHGRILMASRDKGLVRDVPFVFIGNNDYDPSWIAGRTRHRVDGGVLSLWVPKRSTRFAILRLALRAVVGRLRSAKDLERTTLPEVWVDVGRRHVRVAADGEVRRMKCPLHYRVRPGALHVLAP